MSPIRLRVQEVREARGLTQAQLAELAGVRRATISQAENGATVNLATLEKLADALGVNATVLIDHSPAKPER